jgi:hypothetical protein
VAQFVWEDREVEFLFHDCRIMHSRLPEKRGAG